MNFCGIDQSITNTGIVIIDEYGKIVENLSIGFSKFIVPERHIQIYNFFSSFVKNRHNTVFGVEDYAFGKVFKRETMGALRGIIELVFAQNNIPLEIVPIKKHRKGSVGNGNYSKEKSIDKIKIIYGHEFKTKDEYDAFSIAVFLLKNFHSTVLIK